MNKSYAVRDLKVAEYVAKLYSKQEASLQHIRDAASKAGMPDIHVSPLDALHLEVIVRMLRAKKAVEIGTLAGYSGTAIARALPKDGKLYTFENDSNHAKIANEMFKKSRVSGKVEVLVGPAIKNLKKIEKKGPFDFIFMDADKTGYSAYLDWSVKNLRVGGAIAADNTFAFGNIANPVKTGNVFRDQSVRALRAFNHRLANHPRFVSTILPTGEGLSLAVKIR